MAHPHSAQSGRRGEERAAAFLEAHGYRILAQNLRGPDGEIDLVCLNGVSLVVVEVKSRNGSSFGSALGAVDARKRSKLRRLAADYAQIVAPNAKIRFDVVTLNGERVTLHENAF